MATWEHAGAVMSGVVLGDGEDTTLHPFRNGRSGFEAVVRSVSASAGVVPEWYEAPTFYFTNPYALIGTGADVAVPPGCVDLDFELEVAAVIGTDGTNLDPDAAAGHVIGYTVLNDWSARDLQRREMRVSWPFGDLVAYASRGTWVRAGDVLGSGTCGNGDASRNCGAAAAGRTRRRCGPGTS